METFRDKARAFVYAFVVHVLCIGALFIGLLWTQSEVHPINLPGPVIDVDLVGITAAPKPQSNPKQAPKPAPPKPQPEAVKPPEPQPQAPTQPDRHDRIEREKSPRSRRKKPIRSAPKKSGISRSRFCSNSRKSRNAIGKSSSTN